MTQRRETFYIATIITLVIFLVAAILGYQECFVRCQERGCAPGEERKP